LFFLLFFIIFFYTIGNVKDNYFKQWFHNPVFLLALLSLLKLLIHFISNGFLNYGFFRDEFYYIACSEHLALGYVDHPPLSVFILALSRLLFGDSLFMIRFLPAVAGAFVVFLTGIMARELGGGRFAQACAAVAVITVPSYLGKDNLFSMNPFDTLFWAISFYTIILILKKPSNRLWLQLGVVIGLGLLNKISLFWLGFGLITGLLLTGNRRYLITRGPWLAAVSALILFLPHLIWQVLHDFPTLEFMRNATGEKMAPVPYFQFVTDQILHMNPVLLFLWLSGIGYFLYKKEGSKFSLFGFLFIAVFLLLMFNKKSRTGYLTPAYTVLLAGGAVMFEQYTRKGLYWLRHLYLTLIIFGGLIFAPFAIPLLPVEKYISYTSSLGMAPSTAENKDVGKLPQHFADMHGWKEMVKAIGQVYKGLTHEEQADCVIICENYGEAGAVDFLGKKIGLPGAVSLHNNYHLWGPGNVSGDIAISLLSRRILSLMYEEVKQVGMITHEYSMPYENRPLFLCRGLRIPLKEVWKRNRSYQ